MLVDHDEFPMYMTSINTKLYVKGRIQKFRINEQVFSEMTEIMNDNK